MDFTLETYKKLLNTLIDQGFSFLSFEEFISKSTVRGIILRNDVDALPKNSLKFAEIQAEKGIKGTYYFRAIPESFDENSIKEIYSLGHEIGYHYEDMNRCAVRGVRYAEEDLARIAIENFALNLEKLRKIVPVKTICMHGSPISRWDSRVLWKYYDYRDFGIIGEPYFDINFDEVLYLTDTGRRWDGDAFNLRDKAIRQKDLETKGRRDEETKRRRDTGTKRLRDNGYANKSLSPSVPQSLSPSILHLHSTFDIIRAAEKGRLPDKIMMTFHPQRWTDKPLPWVKELLWQNVKNIGKYFVNRLKKD